MIIGTLTRVASFGNGIISTGSQRMVARDRMDNYYDANASGGYGDDGNMQMDLDIVDFLIFLFYTFGIMVFSIMSLILMYIVVKSVIMRLFGLQPSELSHEESLLDPRYLESSERFPGNSARWTRSYNTSQHLDDPNEIQSDLANLSIEDQFYYKQGEDFLKQNPPFLLLSENEFDPIMTEQTNTYIEEEGAGAWEFQPDTNLPNDTIMVENKTDLRFLNFGYEASIMTSLPLPYKNRVYYYECKIYEMNLSNGNDTEYPQDNKIVSIGFATNPYPSFRLPGKHHHSIAYESNGTRRMNSSFKLPQELENALPKVQKGDIMGIGYRTRSGTVFFTHNGKKVKEVEVGGHIRKWKLKYLYPIVGANIPCRVSCNFGTSGFVYIEANVKKWRFGSMHGLKMPPPAYGNVGNDIILENGNSQEGGLDAEGTEEETLINNTPSRTMNEYYDEADDSDSNASETPSDDRDTDTWAPPPDFDFSAITQRQEQLQNQEPYSDAISLSILPSNNPPEYISDLERA